MARPPEDQGGDPACWAHLFDEDADVDDRGDVGDIGDDTGAVGAAASSARPHLPDLPAAVDPGLAGTGPVDLVDREGVEVLVRSFYRQAAMDERLGPVFAAAEVDWPAHIATLIDFWSWQLFGERGYEGNPLLAHRPLQADTPFTPAHYQRWLELFDLTIDEQFRGPMADTAKLKAAKMAAALERLMDGVSADGDVPIAVTVVRPVAGD